jgi:CRISPR-associated protein Cmr4
MKSTLTFIHALSPLHAGTGQGVGVIDLPIAREKATNLPYLPGSTLKGSLRDELKDDKLREAIFGPDSKDITSDSAYSGSVVFTDQKLLCLPVRSLLGTFAWVTSPYILERFKRDCKDSPEVPPLKKEDKKEFCIISAEPKIRYSDTQVILEDLDLTVQTDKTTDKMANDWADFLAKKIFPNSEKSPNNQKWQTYFKQRFCIVSDDVINFLAETATEVIARNKLDDDTKTTVKGALWYEESLPTETILSGLLLQVKGNHIADIVEIAKNPIQLGGSMTVGRGLCQMIIDNGGSDANS